MRSIDIDERQWDREIGEYPVICIFPCLTLGCFSVYSQMDRNIVHTSTDWKCFLLCCIPGYCEWRCNLTTVHFWLVHTYQTRPYGNQDLAFPSSFGWRYWLPMWLWVWARWDGKMMAWLWLLTWGSESLYTQPAWILLRLVLDASFLSMMISAVHVWLRTWQVLQNFTINPTGGHLVTLCLMAKHSLYWAWCYSRNYFLKRYVILDCGENNLGLESQDYVTFLLFFSQTPYCVFPHCPCTTASSRLWGSSCRTTL